MIKSRLFIFALFFSGVQEVVDAKGRGGQFMGWQSYMHHLKINNKYTFNTEIHERQFLSPLAQHQFAYAFRLQKSLGRKRNWNIAPGIAFFQHTTPADPNREFELVVPEIRPQFDFNHRQVLDKISFQHRYRLETRFFHHVAPSKRALSPGYEFNSFKVRYQFIASIPFFVFNEHQKMQFRFGDELHMHFGKKIKKNYFDHNRFFGSVMIDVVPSLALELGYQHWYHQLSEGEGLHRHFLRFGLQQTISMKSRSN